MPSKKTPASPAKVSRKATEKVETDVAWSHLLHEAPRAQLWRVCYLYAVDLLVVKPRQLPAPSNPQPTSPPFISSPYLDFLTFSPSCWLCFFLFSPNNRLGHRQPSATSHSLTCPFPFDLGPVLPYLAQATLKLSSWSQRARYLANPS